MNTFNRSNLSRWLLQLGLAFVFVYAAIDSYREPGAWSAYLPHFLTGYFSDAHVLDAFGLFQIVLAAGLFWSRTRFYAAVIATLMLFGIVVTNLASFLITFRDLGLAFTALALAVQSAPLGSRTASSSAPVRAQRTN